MTAKHSRPRDLPHPRVKDVKYFTETARARARAAGVVPRRVRKADGTSFPTQTLTAGVAPKRPPICLFFEDLAQDEPVTVFGMFPDSLIGKLIPWLRVERSRLLHVCSGALPRGEGIRVDLRSEARPDFIADGRRLPFPAGSIAAALIDPPYTAHYAQELYGVEYPLPSHLLAEAARVVRPGGRIGFVHYIVPNPPPGCHHVKTFGLSMGFGYPMRAVTIYEREQESLPFEETTQPPAPLTDTPTAPRPGLSPARADEREPRELDPVAGTGVDGGGVD